MRFFEQLDYLLLVNNLRILVLYGHLVVFGSLQIVPGAFNENRGLIFGDTGGDSPITVFNELSQVFPIFYLSGKNVRNIFFSRVCLLVHLDSLDRCSTHVVSGGGIIPLGMPINFRKI